MFLKAFSTECIGSDRLQTKPSWMWWLQLLLPQDQPATGVTCGLQRGSSATHSGSRSRFPGNWKNRWKFALSSALKRGRRDPYVRGLAEPPGPRAKLAEVGLCLCFLASHPSPGAGPVCCCFKFCSSCRGSPQDFILAFSMAGPLREISSQFSRIPYS